MDEIFESERLERALSEADSRDQRVGIARRVARAASGAAASESLLMEARARASTTRGAIGHAARRSMLVAAAVTMLGGATVAVAAHDAAPGSLLHPIRRAGQAVVTLFSSDDDPSEDWTPNTQATPTGEPTTQPVDGPDADRGRGNDRHGESADDRDRGRGNDDRDRGGKNEGSSGTDDDVRADGDDGKGPGDKGPGDKGRGKGQEHNDRDKRDKGSGKGRDNDDLAKGSGNSERGRDPVDKGRGKDRDRGSKPAKRDPRDGGQEHRNAGGGNGHGKVKSDD